MSNQARTGAGDAAAFAQQQVYASQGHHPNVVSGKVRPQGYADPQCNPSVYQYGISSGAGDQGSHDTDATGSPAVTDVEGDEFGHGSVTGR